MEDWSIFRPSDIKIVNLRPSTKILSQFFFRIL